MRIHIPATSIAAITGAIVVDTVASQQIIVGSTYAPASPEKDNAFIESTQAKECAFDNNTLTQLHHMSLVDAGILRCRGTNEVCVEDASSSMGGLCVVVNTNDGGCYNACSIAIDACCCRGTNACSCAKDPALDNRCIDQYYACISKCRRANDEATAEVIVDFDKATNEGGAGIRGQPMKKPLVIDAFITNPSSLAAALSEEIHNPIGKFVSNIIV
jgi:hypothetical protein